MMCSFSNRYEQFLLKLFIPSILDHLFFQCPNKCCASVGVIIITITIIITTTTIIITTTTIIIIIITTAFQDTTKSENYRKQPYWALHTYTYNVGQMKI
jgi:hypothetical protein